MAFFLSAIGSTIFILDFEKNSAQNTFFVEFCNVVSAFGTIIVSRLTFYVAISSPFLCYINEEK